MSKEVIWVFMLIVYLLFMCGIGLWIRKLVKNFEDFAVAGRMAPLVIVAASYIGSHYGGGFVMGGTEYGVIWGLGGLWYGVACGFSYLVFLFIVRKIYRMKLMTSPEILDRVYKSKRIRVVFAIIRMLASVGTVGGQILAGAGVFGIIGLDPTLGAIVTFLIIVAYTSASGLLGVMVTDLIQIIIGSVGIVIAGFIALNYVGWWEGLTSSLPATATSLMPFSLERLTWIIVPTTLAGFLSGPSIQRTFSCKSERDAIIAPVSAAIFLIIIAIFPPLIGMSAQVINPGVNAAEALPFIITSFLPIWVAGFVLAALLAAIMSTADGVLLAISTVAVRDIYHPYIKPDASDKEQLLVARVLTVATGLLALGLTYLIPTIIDMLVTAYLFSVAGGLVPFLGGLYWKKGTEKGAFWAMLAGIAFVLLNVFNIIKISYVHIWGILPSLVVYILVSLFTTDTKLQSSHYLNS